MKEVKQRDLKERKERPTNKLKRNKQEGKGNNEWMNEVQQQGKWQEKKKNIRKIKDKTPNKQTIERSSGG